VPRAIGRVYAILVVREIDEAFWSDFLDVATDQRISVGEFRVFGNVSLNSNVPTIGEGCLEHDPK
jgi:hypothetical protein